MIAKRLDKLSNFHLFKWDVNKKPYFDQSLFSLRKLYASQIIEKPTDALIKQPRDNSRKLLRQITFHEDLKLLILK